MSASDIRAGGAFVELFTKNGRLYAGLQGAQNHLQSFSRVALGIGKTLAAGSAAALTTLFASTVAFAEIGSNVSDMAARTNLSTEAVGELGYAAKQAGSDVGALEKAVQKMNANLAAAAQGSAKAKSALSAIGLSIDQLKGLSTDAQFTAIAEGISKIQDPAERTRATLAIFGKGATSLLPLLAQGASGIEAFRLEARELGLAFDPKDVANADALGDSFDSLGAAAKASVFQVGSVLAPALIELTQIVTKNVASFTRLVRENPELVRGFAMAAAVVGALGVGLVAVGVASQVSGFLLGVVGRSVVALATTTLSLGPAIASVVSMLAGVGGSILTFIASPLGLALLVATGLFAYMLYSTGAAQAALNGIGSAVATVFGDFSEAWSGIVAAVSSGNLAAAGKIATTLFALEFERGMATLEQGWAETTGFLQDAWSISTVALGGFALDAFAAIESLWVNMTYSFFDAWDWFLASFQSGWNDASSFVGKGITYLLSLFDSSINFEATAAEMDAAANKANGRLDAERNNKRAGRSEANRQALNDIEERRKIAREGLSKESESAVGSRDAARRRSADEASAKIAAAQAELAKASKEAKDASQKTKEKTEQTAASAKPATQAKPTTARFAEVADIREGGLKAVIEALGGGDAQQEMVDQQKTTNALLQQQLAMAEEQKDAIEDLDVGETEGF